MNRQSYKELVSIIMPAYNAATFIQETIQSVINQTYQNWELLIVDDASTDNTIDKIRSLEDHRIKLIPLAKNSGAAIARNTAIAQAKGEYLAFLDSDDLWVPDKLERQLTFMNEHGYLFTCTEHGVLEENGEISEIKTVKPQASYMDILKNNAGNSTIMYNCQVLGKYYSPDIKRRNDITMWLQVIKETPYLYGMQEPLTIYRKRGDSLSANKLTLIRYQWKLYREIEQLSVFTSLKLLILKVIDVLT